MADGTPDNLGPMLPAEQASAGAVLRPPISIGGAAMGKRRWALFTGEAAVELLLVGVMVALTWGSIGLDLRQQRRHLLAGAARDSGNLARAAAESIGQTVAGIDDVLRLSRVLRAGDPRQFDIAAWASRVNAGRPVALELAVIDQNGLLSASSLGPVPSAIDLSKTDFFRYQAVSDADNLYIGRPALSSGPKQWSVLLTRRLTAPDGMFAGCIVAAVDATWLARLYGALDIGHGTLMLVGNDGTIRAYAAGGRQSAAAAIGQDIANSALISAAGKTDRGSFTWLSPVDAAPQIVGFERLQGYPLIVAIGLDENEVLAPYALYARQDEIFGACLTLLILAVGVFLLGNTRRILASRQLLQDTVDAVGHGIIMVDRGGQISVMNRRIKQLLAMTSGTASGGVKLERLLNHPALVDETGERIAEPGEDSAMADSEGGAPYLQASDDGTIFEVQTHQLDNGGYVRTYADITERKRAEREITYLAYHDPLTGLANRRLYCDRLAGAIAATRQSAAGCAVLSIDLDGFKYANDMYGHMFGDAVLIEVSGRLTDAIGHDGVVARFGGDEFFVLLRDIRQPDAPASLAGRLIEILSEPYRIHGRELLMSASIGIAQCPADAQSVDGLLTSADTALYAAKEGGRGTFRSYEPAMAARTSERRQIEQDLRLALSLDQLHVVYQPVFDCKTGMICRFESLMRWTHPVRGEIPPDVFIPVAEETGLIVTLGHWVLETACAEAVHWPPGVAVAVNLSPKQFLESDLVRSIAAVLTKTGLPAQRLTVEVTEGVLIDNVDRATAALAVLKALGVQIALDDFGTGYSSLSYLHRFPISSIKIDKSFVGSVGKDDDADAVVRAILTLGQSLALRVVAEGVESEAQLEWLVQAGCSEVQGFLLGRAMPPAAVNACLAKMAPIGAPAL